MGWANSADAAASPVGPGAPYEPLPPPMSHRDHLSLIGVYYSTAAALSHTRDFGGGFSWSGFTFEGRQRVYQSLAVGLSLAWQNFDYKSRETATVGQVTVTGVMARQQTVFPLLATAHYTFRDGMEGPLPFLGLGLGAYSVNRILDVGPAARFTDSSWHFGLAPEVGVAFPGTGGALLVACRFHYAFKMDDTPQQTYFNFSVGGAFDD